MNEETTERYAIVEIMGHDRIAGRVSEVSFAGIAMLAVDVPAIPALPEIVKSMYGDEEWVLPAFTGRNGSRKMFGGAAIFSMRYCSQEEALADEATRVDRPSGSYRKKTVALLTGCPSDDPSDDNYDPDYIRGDDTGDLTDPLGVAWN